MEVQVDNEALEASNRMGAKRSVAAALYSFGEIVVSPAKRFISHLSGQNAKDVSGLFV